LSLDICVIVYYLVAWAFVMQGAVMVPHYNSRATVVVFVVEGTGRFEMACPYLSSQSQERQGRREQEEEESSGEFQRVSARLSPGDAFVIPAGHPISVVASEKENLRLVGFGINGHDNRRNFLAGNRSSQLTFSKQTKV
jgi:mannose-6-phosphate isomerase-like protein (cupin superfamily)